MQRGPIILGGLKHCGKSTLGRIAARVLMRPWRDSDVEIERNHDRRPVRELYREYGEETFRRMEAEALTGLIEKSPRAVISLGGGAPGNVFIDWNAVKQHSLFVFLNVSEEIAYRRILRRGLPPFLAAESDPHAAFLQQARERIARYRELADCTLDITEETSPQITADALIRLIRKELEK